MVLARLISQLKKDLTCYPINNNVLTAHCELRSPQKSQWVFGASWKWKPRSTGGGIRYLPLQNFWELWGKYHWESECLRLDLGGGGNTLRVQWDKCVFRLWSYNGVVPDFSSCGSWPPTPPHRPPVLQWRPTTFLGRRPPHVPGSTGKVTSG